MFPRFQSQLDEYDDARLSEATGASPLLGAVEKQQKFTTFGAYDGGAPSTHAKTVQVLGGRS